MTDEQFKILEQLKNTRKNILEKIMKFENTRDIECQYYIGQASGLLIAIKLIEE